MSTRLALLGTGLIGGSLGLACKRQAGLYTVVGFDEPAVLDRALERGAIDVRAASPEAAVADADLVVLATPLAPMLRLLEAIAPHVRPGTFITDVGSVKRPVVAHAAEVLPAAVPFVGGHPMAGAEHGGIDQADALLFENATWVLCPPDDLAGDAFIEAYAPLTQLVRATGARLLLLSPERHDRIAAAVSHLPQLLAVLLMNEAGTLHDDDEAVLQLAAGGFRDMTRIAASPFPMWRDILVANEGPILDALSRFATGLQRLRNRLAMDDLPTLEAAFQDARRLRTAIPRDTKGFLSPLADVYVFTEDQPGALLAIVQTLTDAGLSIKDIELLKIREGTGGTFRLGFSEEPSAENARRILTERGYPAHRP